MSVPSNLKPVRTLLLVCLVAGRVSGATIVVNFGGYPSAQRAAAAEAAVNWQDADRIDDTISTESFAAVELQRYLRKITAGTGFSIADDDRVPPSGDLVVVGGPRSNRCTARHAARFGLSQKDLDALGPEGYVIRSARTDRRRITVIAGGGRAGTLYGVYDLLHRLGVRWYAPGESNEEVPSRQLQPFPEFDVREKPAFATRGFHAWENRADAPFLHWMARNRLNYWCVQQEPKPLLHKLGILLAGGGHILTEKYLGPGKEYPYDHPRFTGDDAKPEDPYEVSSLYQGDADRDGALSYFEAHPEWYAFRGGKRSKRIRGDFGDNFCTSNEHALSEWTKNAVEDLAMGSYREADVINAWMLDVGKWCECTACKALGTPTDRNLLVVHRYAMAIKKAQADKRINRPVRLLFLAYADVLEPPARPLPPEFDYEMCIATYYPIVRCYVHDFAEPLCSKNARYNKHFLGWSRDPDRRYRGQICIGEYYNVSGYKCLPICFMSTMAKDIPYYYDQGARHFHYMHCTTNNWGNKALTNWQMARQLWNPRSDSKLLWNDYFNGRYGPASAPMREFYENLERMLCNVSELKYSLGRRLGRGEKELFPSSHLKYGKTASPGDDGPDLVEIVAYARKCRRLLEGVLGRDLPPRIRRRVVEDESLFAYGERTVLYYDALCRTLALLGEGNRTEAGETLREARSLADLLKADTASTRLSSTHANAADALDASYAASALERLERELHDR